MDGLDPDASDGTDTAGDGGSLTTHVYGVISEMLLSGALKPGDRIPLRGLAERLDVSVMPIRAAIGRLAARGALRVEPKRAVAVPILCRAEFIDLTRNRIHLERWAVSLAAGNGMASASLRVAEQAFLDALSRDDAREAVRTNKALHFLVYEAAGSPVLMELVRIMWLKAGPIINFDLGEQSRRSRHAASLETHARLIAAILGGDPDAAADALAEDIGSAAAFILSRDILPEIGEDGMDLDLRGSRVLVTGGAAGIGRAIVEGFRAEGAAVAVCDVDPDALATLPDDVFGGPVDVADADALGAFVDVAVERIGGLDCLVNNAGIAGPTAAVEDIDLADWNRTVAICLTSQFVATSRAVAALRRSDNASIVNLSSVAGRVGFPRRSPYAAAKWGVVGLTKSLAIELGPDRIRVNAIMPGLVAGDRQRRVLEARAQNQGRSFDDIEAEAFTLTSIAEYVTPEQIADQVLFLASPRGRTISGQAISICGDTRALA